MSVRGFRIFSLPIDIAPADAQSQPVGQNRHWPKAALLSLPDMQHV
jgi:hypothetical protein